MNLDHIQGQKLHTPYNKNIRFKRNHSLQTCTSQSSKQGLGTSYTLQSCILCFPTLPKPKKLIRCSFTLYTFNKVG